MSDLSIKGLRKAFGALEVLKGIDLEVKSGEFVVFVGPSGCGKSTLLRAIAGLDEVQTGSISIGGEEISDLPPSDRGIAMVFQSYALYPHMTVRDNLAFGLKVTGRPRAERDERVRIAATLLQIDAYLDRYPKELSGGQRQRVAIGRAITRDPKVFLFDEPLSNLDAALRVATRVEISKLKEKLPDTTMVYVTHDQVEAMTLADRIVVLQGGRIEQIGTPMDLYRRPRNAFVAGFIGSPAMNLLDVTLARGDGGFVLRNPAGRDMPLQRDFPGLPDQVPAQLGVRPEALAIGSGADTVLQGTVEVVECLGELTIVYLDIGGEDPVVVKLSGEHEFDHGQRLSVKCGMSSMHLFAEDGTTLANGLE